MGGDNMSKKKKKGKSNWFVSYDSHHLFYTKACWNSLAAKRLRQHWYCIVDGVPRKELHQKIHEKVRYVPVPKDDNIWEVLDQLTILEEYKAISDSDPIEKRLELFIDLFGCIEEPTAEALRKQLEVCESYKPSE